MRISDRMKQQWGNSSISGTNAFTVSGDNDSNPLLTAATQDNNQTSAGSIATGLADLFSSCGNYQANGSTDPYNTTSSSFQTNARAELQNRQSLNQEIGALLKQKGIQLDAKTKLTLSVDATNKITVAGAKDAVAKAQIEEALNSKDNLGTTLVKQNVVVQLLNNKDVSQLQYDKWEVASFLQSRAGQDIKDLKLVDGKLTGANDKLTQLISSATKSGSTDAKKVQEMLTTLQKVLTYGQDKIPDMKMSIDYQNGSLIDKNVQYGFGPNQLKTWYVQAMTAGNGSGSSGNYWA